MVKLFCRLVIRFERVVLQWPRRRNSVWMPDFIEVALSQPQQNGSVDLAVAAHKVMQAGVKALAS